MGQAKIRGCQLERIEQAIKRDGFDKRTILKEKPKQKRQKNFYGLDLQTSLPILMALAGKRKYLG